MNTPANAPAKRRRAVKAAAAVLLSGCLAASLGLNIYQAAVQNRKVSEYIDRQLERQTEEAKRENQYVEDGYQVGGQYEIRSTAHISDAYLSGDAGQLSAEDKETLSMAGEVLDQITHSGMSGYEKEEAVYLWMARHIGASSTGAISRPGMTRSAFTPHDVLESRTAVCVGYATTFRLFMNMLRLDCRVVHNEYHSWNLVRLEDGWYHVDVYGDAHGVLYGNFNMTDAVARDGHSWDESALPEAKSLKYTPAVQNGIPVDGVLDVPAALKQTLDGSSGALFFQFKSPLTQQDMEMAEFLVRSLEPVLSGMLDERYYCRASWYPGEEDSLVLGLLLESHRVEDQPAGIDAGTPEGQAIIRAVAEAFGVDPAALGGQPHNEAPGPSFTLGGGAAG